MELTRPTTPEISQPPLDFITGSLQENLDLKKVAWTTSEGTPVELSSGKKFVLPDLQYEVKKAPLTEHKVEKAPEQKEPTLFATPEDLDFLEKGKAVVSQSSQERENQTIPIEGQQVASKKINWDLLKIPEAPRCQEDGFNPDFKGEITPEDRFIALGLTDPNFEANITRHENPLPSAPLDPDSDLECETDSAFTFSVAPQSALVQKGDIPLKKEETLQDKKIKFKKLLLAAEKELEGLQLDESKRQLLDLKMKECTRFLAVLERLNKAKEKNDEKLVELYETLLEGIEYVIEQGFDQRNLSERNLAVLEDLRYFCHQACSDLANGSEQIVLYYKGIIFHLLNFIKKNVEGYYGYEFNRLVSLCKEAVSKKEAHKIFVYGNQITTFSRLAKVAQKQREFDTNKKTIKDVKKLEAIQNALHEVENAEGFYKSALETFKKAEVHLNNDEERRMYNQFGVAQIFVGDAFMNSDYDGLQDAVNEMAYFEEAIEKYEKNDPKNVNGNKKLYSI